MASQSAGVPSKDSQARDCPPGAVPHEVVGGDGNRAVLGLNLTVSPLTFGKVFGAIPRVTSVNTPNINELISKRWGLPEVASSNDFKKIYIEGRATMRYVYGSFCIF